MSAVAYTLLATEPRPQSPSTPTQAMSDDQTLDLIDILRSGEDSRLRRARPERNNVTASPAVVLFCGSDKDSEADYDEHRPWIVQMIPETQETTSLPARKRQKRSNGCGARIHARAVPDRRWRALLDGASADVVELEDRYFTPDMKRELLMGKERCGCRRDGVGCAIWSVFILNHRFRININLLLFIQWQSARSPLHTVPTTFTLFPNHQFLLIPLHIPPRSCLASHSYASGFYPCRGCPHCARGT